MQWRGTETMLFGRTISTQPSRNPAIPAGACSIMRRDGIYVVDTCKNAQPEDYSIFKSEKKNTSHKLKLFYLNYLSIYTAFPSLSRESQARLIYVLTRLLQV
ncbi:hypothetical protein AA313_de0201831 [Arthrobotrys entomopaga]|nr:hypothetical protein AA313_de0201831 [Arthrobotrys entomopaga]